MQPLVSILIPCYNAEQWLTETIESALAQTWQNKEIIVVDDGSTDNSLDIAKQFESSIVKVISQENRGGSAARNTAYKACQGEFIQYLDADDLLAPTKIESQIKLLDQEDNVNCVAAGEWARFYKTSSEAQFIPQPPWADMPPVEWLVCTWSGHWMMHPAAWLVPRHIANKAGLWNEDLSLNDDGEYFCRVVLASIGVKFCWGAKSYYRSGSPISVSASKSDMAWESAFQSLEIGTSNLLITEDSLRTRQVCATVFQRFIHEVYPDVPDLLSKAESKVEALGTSNIELMGGPIFHLISTSLGWKNAKVLQKLFYQLGYRKMALGNLFKLSKPM